LFIIQTVRTIIEIRPVLIFYLDFVSIWYSIWTLLNAASMMNILAFELPRGNSSKGPSGSSSKVTVVTTASTPSSTDVPMTPKSVAVEV
jgi:hypothetical protein